MSKTLNHQKSDDTEKGELDDALHMLDNLSEGSEKEDQWEDNSDEEDEGVFCRQLLLLIRDDCLVLYCYPDGNDDGVYVIDHRQL